MKTGLVTGRLEDNLQPVADATVSLVNATDSSLIAFSRTDSLGKFSFNHLQPGSYCLSASHINFHPQWKNFEFPPEEDSVNLGRISLKDKTVLDEVTLRAQRPPVEVNGDTLEFIADISSTIDRGSIVKKLNTRFTFGTNIAYNRWVNFIHSGTPAKLIARQ
ncbi:MAG: carboxypeptidase-like regulatory domain-containing protein [Ferruginibacter sp.]